MSESTPVVTTADGSPLPYADALAELEGILNDLESAAVDVDTLARKVERASALVRHCRARLDVVRDDVAAVVVDLGADDGADD